MGLVAIESLQYAMQQRQLDVWLQPVADEFQGEYPAAYAQRLEYLCGFTGSAGLGVFKAEPGEPHLLFTDGRYTIQARAETDPELIQVQRPDESFFSWLKEKEPNEPFAVGFHSWSHSYAEIMRMKSGAGDAVSFEPLNENIVDTVWNDQQKPPTALITLQPDDIAGVTATEKLNDLKLKLAQSGAEEIILSLPDDICWLLNIRGDDTDYNPLVLAYLKVTKGREATLFTAERELSQEVQQHFDTLNVRLSPIQTLWREPEMALNDVKAVWLTPEHVPYAFFQAAQKQGCPIIGNANPVQHAKAVKNAAELNGIRQAHRYDGAAISAFLCEAQKKPEIDELQVEQRLQHFRKAQPHYYGPSFATIAGSGGNGAIVHYRATEKTNRAWQENELLLIDSGGQYAGGTTDITRMLVKGMPSAEMKDRYTRVLKGHIALACAEFPAGTTGGQLDVLARQYLWEIGCDYDHGTGHGVGAYLCVHEGPQSISKRVNNVPLQAGMVLSNEPGFYKKDAYGIRIENLVTVVSYGVSANAREMLGFETLTLVPIETALIDASLLTQKEMLWLNDYHQRVFSEIAPLVDAETKLWLEDACKPVAA